MEHTIHDHKVPCDDLWRHEDNDDWDDEDDDENVLGGVSP